jgi:hypothetical protein
MKFRLLKSVLRVLAAVAFVVGLGWVLLAQPTLRRNRRSNFTVDPATLRGHVEMLSQTFHPRDWRHRENLDACAQYIEERFKAAGAKVETQPFQANKRGFKNVIAKFNPGKPGRIVVGAHYDACGDTPGADDNASGISVLLELAALIGKNAPETPVDLVAYTLEEPPFFRTEEMGSAVHAKSIAAEKSHYRGVVVLEMVGCFKDEPGSQKYPMPLLRCFYPSRGNFVSVVGRWDQGGWVKAIKVGMKGATDLPVYSIRAPESIPGIDFSDHHPYWPYGIEAVMITDTAFYRNLNYHEAEDTAEKLDYHRMAKVAVAVFEAIRGR